MQKTSILTAAFCGVCGLIGLATPVIPWALGDICRIPNPNEVLCYHPGDAIDDCDGGTYPACSDKVYVINDFPDSTVESEKGSTKEELTDCWQALLCEPDTQIERCVPSGVITAWHQVAKTLVLDPKNPDCSE